MKRLLIIGCGDVAMRAIPLLTRRYRVFALVRNPAYREKLRALGVLPIVGDLDDRASLACIAGLADAVLHFAPPANSGTSDARTHNLLSALSRGALPTQLVYIGTSGVYGDCGGAVVSESQPLRPQTARTQRRADAERQIRNWAKRNHVKASILRVPGIYAADRLPLARLQQACPDETTSHSTRLSKDDSQVVGYEQGRRSLPCIIDSEDSYTNHIHADDLARIAVAALRYGKACRVYHASDDSQLKMGGYFDAVADAFGLSQPPRVSRAEAQRVLPEMLLSFMNESRRLNNRRMKRELRVRLYYPTVADMLTTIKLP